MTLDGMWFQSYEQKEWHYSVSAPFPGWGCPNCDTRQEQAEQQAICGAEPDFPYWRENPGEVDKCKECVQILAIRQERLEPSIAEDVP